MLFETEIFEKLLKCSFCSSRFSSMIKLIPECGNSICQSCHDELRKEAKDTTQYVCKECGEKHSMPENGLAENKALEKMLTLQEAAETESKKEFASHMKEFQARIDKLKNYNVEEEITLHCEKLSAQVMAAIEEAFEHLNKLGNNLLAQINDYKNKVVGDSCEESRAPKRFKSSETSTQEEIDSLSKEIERLESRVLFNQMLASNDDVFASAIHELDDLQPKLCAAEAKRKKETFAGGLMKFEPNILFVQISSHIGLMHFETLGNETSSVDTVSSSSVRNLAKHTDCVNQVMFLPNGDMASCSDDRTIKIWNYKKGELLYELTGSMAQVKTMCLLPPNYLASGYGDGAIYIWNMDQRSLIHKKQEHSEPVFSLQVLENGHLVSGSFDGSIKIWEFIRGKLEFVDMLFGHCIKYDTSIGVLSDDLLVTSCNDQVSKNKGNMKVWSLSEKRCVKYIWNTKKDSSALLVFKRSRRVAVASVTGFIKIYLNISVCVKYVQTEAYQVQGRISLAESPDGYLLSGGPARDPTIKIWSTANLELIRIIQTDHTDSICWISVSPDRKTIVTASRDTAIKLIAF